MPVKKLKEFLENQKIKYDTIRHELVYSTQQIAEITHIRGQELAKTVMVIINGKMAMAVLPASYKVDLELLKKTAGARTISMATEGDFKNLFSECEVGAMPPFGNLYGMDVYVEEKLAEDNEIAFNAGNHLELIKLAFQDFARLVRPVMGRFTTSKVPAF